MMEVLSSDLCSPRPPLPRPTPPDVEEGKIVHQSHSWLSGLMSRLPQPPVPSGHNPRGGDGGGGGLGGWGVGRGTTCPGHLLKTCEEVWLSPDLADSDSPGREMSGSCSEGRVATEATQEGNPERRHRFPLSPQSQQALLAPCPSISSGLHSF